MEYRTISEEQALDLTARFRRDQAAHAERQAVADEMHAEQYRRAAKELPEHVNARADFITEREEIARANRLQAQGVHAKAGTTPETPSVAQHVLGWLRAQLGTWEVEHLRHSELAANPEIYGGDEADRDWHEAFTRAQVQVAHEWIDRLAVPGADDEDATEPITTQ